MKVSLYGYVSCLVHPPRVAAQWQLEKPPVGIENGWMDGWILELK